MATERLRADLAAGRAAPGDYDFGPGRTEWERLHATAAELVATWLPTLPAGVRRHAQAQVYRDLHQSGPGPYAATRVSRALKDVEVQLS